MAVFTIQATDFCRTSVSGPDPEGLDGGRQPARIFERVELAGRGSPGSQAGNTQRSGGLANRGSATPAPTLAPLPARGWADRNVRHGAPSRCRGRLLESLMQPGTDLLGRQLRPLPLLTGDDDTSCSDTGETSETENLPKVHEQETLP
jgi:hypothetical protein